MARITFNPANDNMSGAPDTYHDALVQRKTELYQTILPQADALIKDEPDLIANMANIASLLQSAFGFLWTGFYLVKDNLSGTAKELVLGPFQGPLACTRIPYGKGVCGTACLQNKTIVVPDVHAFPGHIACSSLSRSEIVVPLRRNGEVFAVLDIDSAALNTFDSTDQRFLEQLALCFDH